MFPLPLCLNTSTIRPCTLMEKIRIAADSGYNAIEPWNTEIDECLAGGGSLADIRKAISEEGLEVVSMIALGGWTAEDPSLLQKSLEECRRRMEQAAALGSAYIVASPPGEAVTLPHAARCYAELLRIGREIGIRPAMEFLGFVDGIHTLPAAWAIAAAAGDPEPAIVPDTFHLLRGGGSFDDLLLVPGSHIAIFHINDLPSDPPFHLQTDADRVLPGDGVANLAAALENLRHIGYKGHLSLELFNPSLWQQDPREVARRGRDRLIQIMNS